MKKLLAVIDYQKDFVDGALGFAGAEKLDAYIAAKVREYAADPDASIVYTMDTHGEDYLETREGRNLPVVHCVKGTEGWEYYGETAKALEEAGAKRIEKRSFGMDAEKEAKGALPEEADVIELCGLVSNICVISNAVTLQTRYPEASLVVDRKCIGSNDPALNDACIAVMGSLQVKIL